MRYGTAFMLALSVTPMFAPVAYADTTAKDLQVLGRSLGFVKSAGSSSSRIAIVYDPKKPASLAEAESIQTLIGSGLKSGSKTLAPVLVKIDEMGGTADLAAFLLTTGLGGDAAKVGDAAKAKQIPCATTDLPTVQGGQCLIGIRTEPKVEISVNKAVLGAEGITLDDAFKMLIIEL